MSSSIDYSKPPKFDDISLDILELYQYVETLRPMMMVMSRSHILDGYSKHDHNGIISIENLHEVNPKVENGPMFQA